MLGMTTTMEAVTTGVREIAEALGGGIHECSLMLIEGESKTGKSVLSQYIAYGVQCAKNCSVVYYTTDKSDSLIANMDSMCLYVRHGRMTDRFRIYEMEGCYGYKSALETLGRQIIHMSQLPGRFKLVIVDSISPLMVHLKPVHKIDFLQSCKEICEKGRSMILTLDSHAFDKKTLARAHSMSDYYLKLTSQDMVLAPGQVDTRIIKVLDVTKLHGATRHDGPNLKFEIKPNVGIQILPLIKVRV
jgi:flagellar protein FlaH